MYLVSGTVEESIYQISVSRRLSHIAQKEKENNNKIKEGSNALEFGGDGSTIPNLTENVIDAANSLEMQDATLGKLMTAGAGGELVRKDDLWQCLFGGTKKKGVFGQAASDAGGEVDRFLRGEAADQRRQDASSS